MSRSHAYQKFTVARVVSEVCSAAGAGLHVGTTAHVRSFRVIFSVTLPSLVD